MTIIILHTDANAKMMILLAIASTDLENIPSPQGKKCKSKKKVWENTTDFLKKNRIQVPGNVSPMSKSVRF